MTFPNPQPEIPETAIEPGVEQVFISEQPPLILPKNSNSNFGALRRVITKPLEDAATDLAGLHAETFPSTALGYLGLWEAEVGLPKAPPALTVTQRRSLVQTRRHIGPFTRTRRREVVERFIVATFGPAVQILPSGIPLDADGVPLFSGEDDLAGTYSIRENWPELNLAPGPSFETDDLVGAPWSGTSQGGDAAPIIETTTDVIHGSKRVRFTGTVAGGTGGAEIISDFIAVDRTKPYALTAYFKRIAGSAEARSFLRLQAFTSSDTFINTVYPSVADPKATLQAGAFSPALSWSRVGGIFPANVLPATTAKVKIEIWLSFHPTVVQDIALDAVQFENSDYVSDFSDPQGSSFFYEVRLLDTLDVDLVGLERELRRITPAHIDFVITETPNP